MMRKIVLVLAAAGLVAAGYFAGKHGSHAPVPEQQAKADRKPLYWHDPMYPQQKFDKPGKSPFMDMQLVPVYGDEKSADSGVTVSARAQQNLGVRTAVAQVAELRDELRAVGSVTPDERRFARAESRVAGWVEKLHARAVNDAVRAGQVLAEIHSPDLAAAQGEYLLARRMAQSNPADAALAEAARRKLIALGMPESSIAGIESSGEVRRRVPLLAPISGVISELGVREGAMVQAGTAAFTIIDLSTVWVVIELPEVQSQVLRPGLRAEVRTASAPQRALEGKVDYVYPDLNAQTRTVKARVVLPNPGLALRPGMYADVTLASSARKSLVVPAESVIRTGARSVVIVADGDRFRAATVKVGADRGERTEILEGLKAGERVVASGQFLIDSEASLKGALDRLGNAGTIPGKGKVTAVDAAKGRIELDHEPIPALKWPRMTMEFVVEDKAAFATLKKGDAVEFEMRSEANKEGDWVLPSIRRTP